MSFLRIAKKGVLFSLVVVIATFIVQLIVSNVYSFLLQQYSLPKTELNLLMVSFFISFFFISFLSLVSDYWRMSKTM
jgi:membrane protein insertase Oxa1/YidC/SpoIIIJ